MCIRDSPRTIEFGNRLEDVRDFGRVERAEFRMRWPGQYAIEVVGIDALARLFLLGSPEIQRHARAIASRGLLSRGHIVVRLHGIQLQEIGGLVTIGLL